MVGRLTVAIAIAAGAVVAADFLVGIPVLDAAGGALVAWVTIVLAFACLLGLANVLQVHARRVARWEPGWPYSVVLVVSLLVVLILGLRPGSVGPADAGVAWLFGYVYVPLNATVFSLLAFFVASAAYRAFRVRSLESSLLLVVGLIVLLGQVPLGFQIWPDLPLVKDWLLQVLSVAGLRGILLGVALGTVAAGLRLLLGQDRPYLGM